jgi:hypothetical protein
MWQGLGHEAFPFLAGYPRRSLPTRVPATITDIQKLSRLFPRHHQAEPKEDTTSILTRNNTPALILLAIHSHLLVLVFPRLRPLPRIIFRPHPRTRQMPSRKPLHIKITHISQHRLYHPLALSLQLGNSVLHHACALQAHREELVELAQLIAIQVRFARFADRTEERIPHVVVVVRAVRAHLLCQPVAPHREA